MVLDATVGGATANSYVTNAEAVAYMGTHLYASAWLALPSAEQDTSLMMATRLIDTSVCFVGTSATTTQALRFPMVGLVTPTGAVVPSDVIPVAVKDATSELARLLATTDTTAPNEAAAQGLTNLKVASVELGFKDDIETNSVPTTVRAMFPPSWLCLTPEQLAALVVTTSRSAIFQVI